MATKTLPLRLDEETIARLDKLAEVFTLRSVGAEASRSSVMRLALQKGIEFYEKDFGIASSRKATKKKR